MDNNSISSEESSTNIDGLGYSANNVNETMPPNENDSINKDETDRTHIKNLTKTSSVSFHLDHAGEMDNNSLSSEESTDTSSKSVSVKHSLSHHMGTYTGFGYLTNAKIYLIYEHFSIRPREESNNALLKDIISIKFQDAHGLYKLNNPHLFLKFPSLKHIVFHHNNTDTLHRDLFKELVHLETVDFSHNELKHINPGLFHNGHLEKLTKINFSYNRIAHLCNEVFYGLSNLIELDLNSNSITHIDGMAFDGLISLRHLNLSYNDLTRLDDDLFKNTRSLCTIRASYNEIKELHPIIFRGLVNLKLIDFEGNYLTFISIGMFAHLRNLSNVNFSHNQITQIDLPKLFNLIYEHLEDNLEQFDFRCDYENTEKFKFASFLSLFFEFYMVHECDKYKEISLKELLFQRHINMWYLSRHIITKDTLEVINEDIFENLDAEKYSPLDFFLAINKIPSKVISNLVNYIEHILKGAYNKEVKNEDFKVKCVESVGHLCERDNVDLMRDVIKYFNVNDFSACFDSVLENKNENMAIILFNHFWGLIVEKFKSDTECYIEDILIEYRFMMTREYLKKCCDYKWWHFYRNLVDIHRKADEEVKALFLIIFEHTFEENSKPAAEVVDNELAALNEEGNTNNARTSIRFMVIKEASTSHVLNFISESKQPDLIQHPTTVRFLRLKWAKLPRFVYLFNMFLYILFVILYTVHLETIKRTSLITYSIFRFASLFLASLFLMEEFLQIIIFIKNLRHHFTENVQNVFECINYPLCVLTLSTDNLIDEDIKYSLDAITIILTYAILILRVEKFEFIGLYVTVLKKILNRSVKVLPLIILTTLAFFFAFRVISKRHETSTNEVLFNSSISYTLIKLLTMNLGDFETEKMGLGKEDESLFADLVTYVLYAIYLFFLPILILNIFVGISVDEMRNLIDESQKRGLMIKISYVLKFQDTLIHLDNRFDRIRIKCIRRLFKKAIDFLIRDLLIDKNRNSKITNFHLRKSHANELAKRHNQHEHERHNVEHDIEIGFEHIEDKIGKLESRVNEIDVDTKAAFVDQKNQLTEMSSLMFEKMDRLLTRKLAKVDELHDEITKIRQYLNK